jgi:CheY-like chemotaxis protein
LISTQITKHGKSVSVSPTQSPIHITPTIKSVVLVEDDLAIREALREFLHFYGYEVFEAADGSIGLQVLRNIQSPGLVLLDLMMPVMTGWEFLAAKSIDPKIADIPVIVLSAASPQKECVGAVATLSKPIDLDALLAQIRHYCGIAPD